MFPKCEYSDTCQEKEMSMKTYDDNGNYDRVRTQIPSLATHSVVDSFAFLTQHGAGLCSP